IWPENNGEIASRLRIEQNHHDIDIYEALLGALHAIAARKNLDEVLRAATLSACADLASLVDTRVAKLAAALCGRGLINNSGVVCASFDQLLEGNTSQAISTVRRQLEITPNSIHDA